MTLASLGWGTWWVMLFLHRFAPAAAPGLTVPAVISTVFATLGLAAALLSLRARRAWLFFLMIPLLANSSLLLMPWLAEEITAAPG